MQRASLILLLTCICSPAMAQSGRVSAVAPDHTACDEIVDKRPVAARPVAVAQPAAKPMVALRAKPALSPAPASRGGGDEGSDGSVIPRPRSPKWHSFLPGMFR